MSANPKIVKRDSGRGIGGCANRAERLEVPVPDLTCFSPRDEKCLGTHGLAGPDVSSRKAVYGSSPLPCSGPRELRMIGAEWVQGFMKTCSGERLAGLFGHLGC